MPKIDIYSSRLNELGVSLRKASNKVADAYRSANSVSLSGIELSAKSGWISQIEGTKGKINSEANALARLASIADSAAEQFDEADRQSIKGTYSIIDRLKLGFTNVATAVKNIFSSWGIGKAVKVNAIFLSGGTVLSSVLLGLLRDSLKRIGTPVSINGHSSGDGRHDNISSVSGAVVGSAITGAIHGEKENTENIAVNQSQNTNTTAKQIYPGCKEYNSGEYASVAYKEKDYSNFQIVGGMTAGYCIAQTASKYGSKFNSVGCLATADSCMGAIRDNTPKDPLGSWNGSGASCKYSTRIKNSWKWTPDQIRKKAYEEVTNGRPVVVRVVGSEKESGGYNGHSVTVVGIREGADPNALTDADFLIMDPADGKIKTLADRSRKNPNDPSTCLDPANDDAGMRVLK